MRSALWRGDLARLLHSGGTDEAARLARMLGLREAREDQAPKSARGRAARPEPARTPLEDSPAYHEAEVPFLRVFRNERVGPAQETKKEELDEEARNLVLRPEDLEPRPTPLPSREALESWPRLWQWLRRATRRSVERDEVDADELVRRLGRGEILRRIPRRRRALAATQLWVIVDRSRRTAPFWPDQDELIGTLTRLYGRCAIVTRVLLDGPDSMALAFGGGAPVRAPSATHAPVVLLGDLGAYSGLREQLAWQAYGERLAHQGYALNALVPSPPARVGRRLARLWNARTWDRGAAELAERRLTDEQRAERALRLLRLLSPAVRVEPGLLREARLLLGRTQADVGTELDAWNHPFVQARSSAAMAIDREMIGSLRMHWAREAPDVRRAFVDALRAWHAALPPEVWAEEAASLADLDPSAISQQELHDAERALLRALHTILKKSSDEPAGLRPWFRRLRERVPRDLWLTSRISDSLGRAWAEVYRGEEENKPPPGVEPKDLSSGEHRPTQWDLLQEGGTLRVAALQEGERRAGSSWLVTATLSEPVIELVRGTGRQQRSLDQRTEARFSLPDRVDPTVPDYPDWALDFGRDRFGYWAVEELAGVRVRMRWIAPARFLMGSPESEFGRWDDEPRHEVEISRGFWLAETPCIQELWEAVTGENPSEFQGPDRPVENVSWNQVGEFLGKISEQTKGSGDLLRLPTEAEWELACRAGSTTATYAGDFDEGSAEGLLESIAWWGGNADDETHPVAMKEPNAAGLFDMLGNIIEWTADCCDSEEEGGFLFTTAEGAIDPVSLGGKLRVVRGGSWCYDARLVRAAVRSAAPPGDRYADLGFRLARGQPLRSSQGEAQRGAGRTADAERPGRGPAIRILTDHDAWELDWTLRPSWAESAGRDRVGLWADLEIKTVRQRFRWIPPGPFLMGADESDPERMDHEVLHRVRLSRGYWLADTPCTQELWFAATGERPSQFKGERQPVESVSYRDVEKFLGSLVSGAEDGEQFRMPTEAEWEHACRAGSEEPRYGEPESIAWYSKNSKRSTHPVAELRPNEWGLFDMLGNVYEWCMDETQDWKQPAMGAHGPDEVIDPVSLEGGRRVVRGGSWRDGARGVRAAYRFAYPPGDRYDYLGFRLARGQPVRSSKPAAERGAGRVADVARSADEEQS